MAKPKDAIPAIERVGVCIKTRDGRVEYQNRLCVHLCGDKEGSVCEKGCMHQRVQSTADPVFDRGFKLLKNANPDDHSVDAVMIDDGEKLITFLYDKAAVIQQQLDYLKQFNLSKAEMGVIESFLSGLSNQETAAKLFISRATLRTHLNNIYKKLPEKLKEEILASHLGSQIKKKA